MRLLHFHFKNQNKSLKGTGAKRDVCPGSSVSTRAEFLVVLAESAPMVGTVHCTHLLPFCDQFSIFTFPFLYDATS